MGTVCALWTPSSCTILLLVGKNSLYNLPKVLTTVSCKYILSLFRAVFLTYLDRHGVFKCPQCNAPRPLRQLSSSYSLLLPCLSLACCILSCHHVHCIIMFSKLAFVRVSQFFPLSVLSPDTLARARGTSEILFYKWHKTVLGMG